MSHPGVCFVLDKQMRQQTNGSSHQQLRTQLFSIAYRMLGMVADAENVVQEAFLRCTEAVAARPRPSTL